MKKIINRFPLIVIISGILLIGACSKNFTIKTPSDSLPIDQALTSEAGLGDALNGADAVLRAPALYGRDFLILGDIQADNTYVEKKNAGRYITQYNYSVTSSDGVALEMWSNAYNGILRATQIINSTATGASVAKIKAQAYAIRGLLYFKLVNIFAKQYTDDPTALGVPIVLTYDPYALPKRNTIKEVYAQIVSDLKAGFADGPDYTNSVHLSKYAIEGILAKVYLYMGDYQNAKAASVDVINNSGFALVALGDYNAFWQNAGIKSDQVEVMFEVDADVANNNSSDDVAGIYLNGYQDIYASSQLDSLYSATDIRKSLLVPGMTKSGASSYIVHKYPNALSGDRDNLKVMRLAEVYLIAAEASLPDNEADALKYLNALMAQRDPGLVYSSTGAALLNDVIKERRKELAFEGDRFYDLNRLKRPIVRANNPGAIPAGQNNVNLVIPYPDNRRVAPIPLNELQANANIAGEQNPGY